ncbi:MAG TPA: hypothetical protein VEM95_07055 [Thermoplasmata archaeon]|nr:hypothetical protein [Thermoplasmata archaeon]
MEVTFVGSIQGHQVERVREIAAQLRTQRPDLKVVVVEGDAAKALLLKNKLNFGPAILVDGRVEYVGVPRWRFLVERLAQVAQGLVNPRTAAPPAPPTPPAKPAAPTAGPAPPPTAPPKPGPAAGATPSESTSA